MGIKSCCSLLSSIKCLSMKDIKAIAETHFDPPSMLIDDIDCSFVAYHLGSTTVNAVEKTKGLLLALAQNGFIVTPICDGSIRHHSKRASIDRKNKREKNRIDALALRNEVLQMTSKMNNANDGGHCIFKAIEGKTGRLNLQRDKVAMCCLLHLCLTLWLSFIQKMPVL